MPTLSYPDLVNRLYDLERLAEPPVPGERSGTFSSYDRSSRYNADTGEYEAWDANNDGSGYVRQEGDAIVAFESQGPGVIWRVWSALPGAGHIQIFIDDATTAVVDLPFRDFFERFGNDIPPLNFPQLTPTLSRGRNRFIPIPYNRSCKIVLAPEWGAYYHFTYTTFSADTTLPQFTGSFDREACFALALADRLLAQRGWSQPLHADEHREHKQIEVPPGTTVQICALQGNRAITSLRVAVEQETATQEMLRELCLSIKWDGEREPSVWSPLGDFFGTAPGINYYRSLPLGMTDAGFYSQWYMPFAEQALIELTNDGTEPRTVSFTIRHQPLVRSANELLRFHAKWHRDTCVEQVQQHGRDIDWPFLRVEGQGRFCGLHLHVWNTWRPPAKEAAEWWYGLWNRKNVDWWWGEGDEKFFVDGEKFPSTFGTGSEDYIGYAWAAEPPFPTFESAFACQPYIEIDANGHTSVNRFHVCDDVPFTSSFEGSIEKYKDNQWGEGNFCQYAATAYWYQQAGQSDPYTARPRAERLGYFPGTSPTV